MPGADAEDPRAIDPRRIGFFGREDDEFFFGKNGDFRLRAGDAEHGIDPIDVTGGARRGSVLPASARRWSDLQYEHADASDVDVDFVGRVASAHTLEALAS